LYIHLLMQTERLLIQPLTNTHKHFIFELLNTAGWIEFIGNRNINTIDDAVAYIERIITNKNVQYSVVTLQENLQPIGIITFIKKDYLEHHDIGFAFLPQYGKQGFAYEAANAFLQHHQQLQNTILATTIPSNINSINLLKKLGFIYEQQIEDENEILQVYKKTSN